MRRTKGESVAAELAAAGAEHQRKSQERACEKECIAYDSEVGKLERM